MKSWQNNEGYADFTAYHALEGVSKMADGYYPKRGDVIKIDGRVVRQGIVIQGFEGYVVYQMICVNEAEENDFVFTFNGLERHVDAGKLNFTFLSNVMEIVGAIDEKIMDSLIAFTSAVLGMGTTVGESAEPAMKEYYEGEKRKLQNEISAKDREIEELKNKLASSAQSNTAKPDEEAIIWKTKAEVYKELYMQLISRVG